MVDPSPSVCSLIAIVLLTLYWGTSQLRKGRLPRPVALRIVWMLFLTIAIAEWLSFSLALWSLALLAFCALREYFSLVDIRLEDRWGILVSYLSIPLLFYLVQIDWYGLFIIVIPVYTFLLMPFFVALGGQSRGIVFSVGVLDFGLFFCVFCMGHIGYLIFFSARMAMLTVLAVTSANIIFKYSQRTSYGLRCLYLTLAILPLCLVSTKWSGVPPLHCAGLGVLIPLLCCMGQFTLREIRQDLGVRTDRLQPGRGRTIESLRLYLFVTPVVFHYLRWFLKWGDL